MLFSLVYFLVGRVLGTGRRPHDGREIELPVLRHQMKVLQRQMTRPRLHRLDRVLLVAASMAMPRGRWSSFVVRPETLLRWHRELIRRKWTLQEEGSPPAGHRSSPRSGTSSSHEKGDLNLDRYVRYDLEALDA
jgi:putative transposase